MIVVITVLIIMAYATTKNAMKRFNATSAMKARNVGMMMKLMKANAIKRQRKEKAKPRTRTRTSTATALAAAGVVMNPALRKLKELKSAFDCRRDIPTYYEYKKFYLTITVPLGNVLNYAQTAWTTGDITQTYKVIGTVRVDDIKVFLADTVGDDVAGRALLKTWPSIVKYYKKYAVIGCKAKFTKTPVSVNINGQTQLTSSLLDFKPESLMDDLRKPLVNVINCNKKKPIRDHALQTGNVISRSATYSVKSNDGIQKYRYLSEMERLTDTTTTPALNRRILCAYCEYIDTRFDPGVGNALLGDYRLRNARVKFDFTLIAFDRKVNPEEP